ncbi:TPA: hypothetical protein I7716_19265, partial [Vibrio vulnificus]|nr:hypothetical protein [Vibrio vulnificus]HAS8497225.1 hypothetical protein [Vibrio vulnificus]
LGQSSWPNSSFRCQGAGHQCPADPEQFTRLSDKQFNTLDGVDYSKNESKELRALRCENKRLKDEMEFLKKVSAYFAKQQE